VADTSLADSAADDGSMVRERLRHHTSGTMAHAGPLNPIGAGAPTATEQSLSAWRLASQTPAASAGSIRNGLLVSNRVEVEGEPVAPATGSSSDGTSTKGGKPNQPKPAGTWRQKGNQARAPNLSFVLHSFAQIGVPKFLPLVRLCAFSFGATKSSAMRARAAGSKR